MKYLIDLDGTLLDGDTANQDSVQFIGELQRRNIDFIIMTNSIKSPLTIMRRLEKAGIFISVDSILNPIKAVNVYLQRENINRVLIVGSKSEIEQVRADTDHQNPEAIILLDFETENVNYNDLQNIFVMIQTGIPVFAASGSPFYIKNGIRHIDTGSFVTLFENAADVQVNILGKPSPEYFNAGITLLNEKPDNITVIGDDWRTDIIGAIQAGCHSVLIKSGKYKTGDEKKCEPQRTVEHLMEIVESV